MTDDNGKAILNIKLKNNKYSVTISFAGDSIYKSSSKKLTFTVCNAPAKLSLNAYSSPYKSGKTFNIKVFNTKTNKIIVGINLKIKVYTSSNYKIYTVTTGKDGWKISKSCLPRPNALEIAGFASVPTPQAPSTPIIPPKKPTQAAS